jgi:sialate O-acetylesterase
LYRVWRRGTPAQLVDPGGKWTTCSPQSVAEFSAAGYYFGKEIHKQIGVPLGLIESAYGATPIESWTSWDLMKADPELKPIFDRWNKAVSDFYRVKADYLRKFNQWKLSVAKVQGGKKQPIPAKPKAPEPDPVVSPWRPGGLYNAMVYPLARYSVKGVVWYQGEQNADRAYQYRKLFPLMIQNWRKAWNSPKLPFIFVQLANFMKQPQQPGQGSKWAELREAQLRTLSVPGTGMVVAIDIGDASNIHPKDKSI